MMPTLTIFGDLD